MEVGGRDGSGSWVSDKRTPRPEPGQTDVHRESDVPPHFYLLPPTPGPVLEVPDGPRGIETRDLDYAGTVGRSGGVCGSATSTTTPTTEPRRGLVENGREEERVGGSSDTSR